MKKVFIVPVVVEIDAPDELKPDEVSNAVWYALGSIRITDTFNRRRSLPDGLQATNVSVLTALARKS